MRTIDRAEARAWLVGQSGLRAIVHPTGLDGLRSLLRTRRCIQLDPLDRIGTNADLVALARVDGISIGDIYSALLPGHAFEHFAKERCLLPVDAFAAYRDQAAQTPWWRLAKRLERLPAEVIDAVLDEVRDRGPLTSRVLSDRGRVEALDWSGWKGTSRASVMALEVLWTRCQIVVCGRGADGKRYDLPQRALGSAASAPAPPEGFARWALSERVEAAGLLARAGGPHWSMLADVRQSALPDRLVAEGRLEEVVVRGSSRRYLAPASFLDREWPSADGRMRIIGPLDSLLWDRRLVRHLFDFDYVWEVYKPADKRRWGYYICPLLHEDRLVGRFEGHIEGGEVVVDRLWREPGLEFDDAAFRTALDRHSAAFQARR